MAKQQNSTFPEVPNRFDEGLNTDVNGIRLNGVSWTHARNAINNSHQGEIFALGNEPSNEFCSSAPYDIIGAIHMEKGMWWIFSTDDDQGHEIGMFDEDTCSYVKYVNDPCLNFSKAYPITGISRPTYNCGHQAYWADSNNPDRTMANDNIPWIQECTDSNGADPGGCQDCVDTTALDCDKILLESRISIPCATISRGPAGGSVLNGSYYVHIAYKVNDQRVTDYFTKSNVVHVFDHDQANASLDIVIDGLDTDNFDEYELVIVQNIAQKTSARILGTFSTNQDRITVDLISPELPAVSLDTLLVRNPVYDKSEGIFSVGKYAYRVAPTGKLDMNYQPLANQIRTKWQLVEYPYQYYKNGGSNVGFMRDEVYPFYIRFVHNTGDVTNSYHIPGRAAQLYEIPTAAPGPATQMMENADYLTVEDNNIEDQQGLTSKVFEMFNTANGTAVSIPLGDGGIVVAEGQMGYWESDEFYPDDKPEVWNVGDPNNPQWDLCGERIRHHKFPENTLYAGVGASSLTNHYNSANNTIRVMGVAFENIQPPVDNDGNVISSIVGYEILRGDRKGNKTVVYKGMINNMREYAVPPQLNTNRQGLYPNYPFNSLDPDPFNSLDETTWEPITGNTGTATNPSGYNDYNPNPNYSKRNFTFHCPDTMFDNPFLGQKELKIYGAMWGNAEASYLKVDGHPKHVFVTDLVFYIGIAVGVGLAIAKSTGSVEKHYSSPTFYQYDILGGASTTAPLTAGSLAQLGAMNTAINTVETSRYTVLDFLDAIGGLNTGETTQDATQTTLHAFNLPGSGITTSGFDIIYKDKERTHPLLKVAQALPMFKANVTEGADLLIDIITKACRTKQFALQYQAYCGYENFAIPYLANRRRIIDEAVYLSGHLQEFKTTHRINNILRNKTVTFDTTRDVADLVGSLIDTTMNKILVSDLGPDDWDEGFQRRASSHYVAFKSRLRSQYGKVHSVRQIPATNCVIPIDQSETGTIFGGDTYIGRYQEKNTFYHFYRWLLNQPDRTEFNYHEYDALQHTAFWCDTDPFDVTEFINSIPTALNNALTAGPAAVTTFFQTLVTPSDKHCFDRLYNGIDPRSGVFNVRNAFFYLFHSSVRDFFVESEFNIDMRDWEDDLEKMHWDVLQDLKAMFAPQRIKAGNYYKIDRGLSVANMPYSKLSWGAMQALDYDPTKAETCFKYYPRRLQYSLPQQTLLKRDNWSQFLANNYIDFSSKVTSVQPVNQTGVMILFENESPGIFPGVDQLFLRSGTSVTVGDGNLFAREIQRLSNAAKELQYGSCQSRRGIVSTPHGLMYMCVDQGKIFFSNGRAIAELVMYNKHWLNNWLPFQILKDFPDYDMLDNPIAGVGCQAIYDNEWDIVYFMKRDFRLKEAWRNRVEYIGEGLFEFDGIYQAYIGDPNYFDDASWTMSYDPKRKREIGWHDWHPNLSLSSKNAFLTIKGENIWRHNTRCDSFCQFYGIDYPFEVEIQTDVLPAVVTLRSIEYYLQVFKYAENCHDRFHVLDFNFDEAIIHNSEQVSGLLKLNLEPKNDVAAIYSYPIVGVNQIDILYSKEEQKYRFNQFWDITRDRGEYSPTAMETIWNTQVNGYIRDLNPLNLNYAKNEMQRKKFRHNQNKVFLRRLVSGDKKMILHMTKVKMQNSPR